MISWMIAIGVLVGMSRFPHREITLKLEKRFRERISSDRFYDDIDGGHYGAGAGHCRVDRAADFTACCSGSCRWIRRLFLY